MFKVKILNKSKTNNYLKISVSEIFPSSKNSAQNTQLITGFKVSPSFSFDAKKIGLPQLNISVRGGVAQNFHQYEIAKDGKSNFQRALSAGLNLNLAITDHLDLTLDHVVTKSFTYEHNAADSYVFGQELGYNINKTFSTFLGHSLGANMLSTNKQEIDIAFYNRNTSSIYMGLNISAK